MRSLGTIFGTLMLLTASAFASADCSNFANNEKVLGFKRLLRNAQQSQIEVLGFKIYEHPIILVATQTAPLCAVVFTEKQDRAVRLNAPMSIPNSVFEYRNEWKKPSESEKQILSSVQGDIAQPNLLIFNVDQSGKDPFSARPGTARFNFAFAAHEGFHFLHQFNSSVFFDRCAGGNQPCWGWQSDDGKNFINEVCYRNDRDVRSLLISEFKALKAAFKSLSTGEQDATKGHLKSFVAARLARYQKLKHKTFQHITWKSAGSCDEAEANLEWTEGAATFVEISYLLKLKEITPDDVLFSLETNSFPGDLFYTMGMLQLAVLEKMQPNILNTYLSQETPLDRLHFQTVKNLVERF